MKTPRMPREKLSSCMSIRHLLDLRVTKTFVSSNQSCLALLSQHSPHSKNKNLQKTKRRRQRVQDSDNIEHVSFFTADLGEVGKAVINNKSETIVTSDKESLGSLQMDSGCSSNVAGLGWWSNYLNNLPPQSRRSAHIQEGGKIPQKASQQDDHVHKPHSRQRNSDALVKNGHGKRRSCPTYERRGSLDLRHLSQHQAEQSRTIGNPHPADRTRRSKVNSNQSTSNSPTSNSPTSNCQSKQTEVPARARDSPPKPPENSRSQI